MNDSVDVSEMTQNYLQGEFILKRNDDGTIAVEPEIHSAITSSVLVQRTDVNRHRSVQQYVQTCLAAVQRHLRSEKL